MNHFFAGDNLTGLRECATLGLSADLVYIDPPFGTRRNYETAEGRTAYRDHTVGSDYLDALELRIAAIRNIMSPAASLYVHINVQMEHRVRRLLDDVMGPENFRNSIARIKCNPKNFSRYSFGNIRDTILFYTMRPGPVTWNPQREPLTPADIHRLYPRSDADGNRFDTSPLHAPGETRDGDTGKEWMGVSPPDGKHWRYRPETLDQLEADGLIHWSANGIPRKIRYFDGTQGKLPQDVWLFKDPPRPRYPTEKNFDMLARIIATSSNPGDTVLDCYAGSGGALVAAAQLGRNFIGMDSSETAQEIIADRTKDNGVEWHLCQEIPNPE